MKKVLGWVAIAFLIIFIAGQPQQAAGVFKAIGSGLVNIANGLGRFISSLVA